MEIPSTPWGPKLPRDIAGPVEADWTKLKAPVEHTFTHFHLQLNVWKTTTAEQSLPAGDGYRWVHQDELVHEVCHLSCEKLSLQRWKIGPACEKRASSGLHHPMGFQRRLELGPRPHGLRQFRDGREFRKEK